MEINKITSFKEFLDGVVTVDIWMIILTTLFCTIIITIWRVFGIITRTYNDLLLETFRTYMTHKRPETIADLTETVKLYKEDK